MTGPPDAIAPPDEPPKGQKFAGKTMLGMPMTDLPVHPAASASAPAQRPPPVGKTMLGVAMPGIAPSAPTVPSVPASGAAPPLGHGRTMLGVAVPGIAPSHVAPHASHAAPHAWGNPPQHVERPSVGPPPMPVFSEPPPAAPRIVQKKGFPVAIAASVGAVLVLGLGVGALLLLRGGTPLQAEAKTDADGRDLLQLTCQSCPDGTVVELRTTRATFQNQAAELVLAEPLAIGENPLLLRVDRPGRGRDEEVKVRVPVFFRLRTDTTKIHERPPSLVVRAEAAPGSKLVIDGKEHTFDPSGTVAIPFPLEAETTGPSDESTSVSKQIAYEITPKNEKASRGTLPLRAAVVPLRVDVPIDQSRTDRATVALSGRAARGAKVSVDGTEVTVSAEGFFDQSVDLTALGERTFEVRSWTPGFLARTERIRVRKIESHAVEAKALDAESPLGFDAMIKGNEGRLAIVEGEIDESRGVGKRTLLVVNTQRGCPKGPCLVRVMAAGIDGRVRGDTLRAYGRFAKIVSGGSGKPVPELEAFLVLPKGHAR